MADAPTLPTARLAPIDTFHNATYLPHDIAYNAAYEDTVADLLLSPPSDDSQALHIHTDSSGASKRPNAILLADIQASALPQVDKSALPLALSDPYRKYTTPILGLRLTHPGGYMEGGPGVARAENDFAARFVEEHGVRNMAELRRVAAAEIERNLDLARERARSRREAREKNDSVRAEIKVLVDQMELETKVLTKARERARERRERKEARRKG